MGMLCATLKEIVIRQINLRQNGQNNYLCNQCLSPVKLWV